ncbi:MAG: hypothetical protein IJ206_05600 [Oscillospiraceae bacterium]|nr:hypothetical protein [Oscillospiraceae bacterium]
MKYTVLSPWAEVDQSELYGLSPRLPDLNGKTIGMFGDFMKIATYMLKVVEKHVKKQYPEVKFSYYEYKTETTDIAKDEAALATFRPWLQSVDCVMVFYGAVPSSSLFLGYNAAFMEKCGKPAVMAVVPRTFSAGQRGVKARCVPGLRIVPFQPEVLDIFGRSDLEQTEKNMGAGTARFVKELVDGLTAPLTEEEKNPSPADQSLATRTFEGTPDEISDLFYSYGWTNGTPVKMPTREAVDEMMRGTDYPADYVVSKIPPMMGLATVEKIAVNAVMAGCLPTYLPVLIAAVKGAMDPKIYLEGWCCSQSTWGPVLTLSGKVAEDIGFNTADHALTPAFRANTTIARAFGYIMMNIGGVRPGVEDLSEMGHEFREGFAMGDSLQNNPWGPVHEDFGFDKDDSCVTMFWPQEHRVSTCTTVPAVLKALCKMDPYGWDPGLAVILTPKCAKMMAEAGWTKQRILEYIVEYARKPAREVDLQWLIQNNHPPKTVDLPLDMEASTRTFWSTEHMFLTVAGGQAGCMVTVLGGGGDHGGPSCAKIELPENWDALCEQYRSGKPDYVAY